SAWSREIPLREQLTTMKRIFSFAKPFLGQFAASIVFAGLLAVTNALLPRIVQTLIDGYFTQGTATVQVVLLFGSLYAGATLLKAVIWYFNLYHYNMASEKTVAVIRNAVYTKLHKLGMNYFDRTPAGSIVSKVTNDTETIKEFWT